MRITVFSLALLLSVSCSINNRKTVFSGHWYTCAHDGLYTELLIKDNYFRYSNDRGIVTKWHEFKISNDTFIYDDQFLYKDSKVVIKAKINQLKKDEMSLDYITSDEHWEFHRIKENISDIENEDNLRISTKQRSISAKCPDNRTDEEKTKDSLVKPIYFNF